MFKNILKIYKELKLVVLINYLQACSKWNRTITNLHYKSFTCFSCTDRLEKRLKFFLYTSLDQQLNWGTTASFQFYTCSCFEFLDETKLISKHQFGFQKKKSTELAAIASLDQVSLAVDNGNLVGACFIDLQNAFDTISHNKLISMLER